MKQYNRINAIKYAQKWAFSRNPKFYAFDNVGGDCTSFVSQCLYAGSLVMNYTPTFGWYYINSTQRSPSWTGVQYLYDFLISNTGPGPFAEEVSKEQAKPGDIIQFGNEKTFYHSVIITGIKNNQIFISAHNFDAYMRNLSDYSYSKIRYLHIKGVYLN